MSTGKRKEIYKYAAPWPLYSMNWSIRPDKRFRLALGSFLEEYNNRVSQRTRRGTKFPRGDVSLAGPNSISRRRKGRIHFEVLLRASLSDYENHLDS